MKRGQSILAAALLCGAPQARASLAPDDARSADDAARALVEQLGAPAWVDRDHATMDLARFDETISLTDLEPFLDDPGLSNEQRARLVEACRARFAGFPKGGLGVSFGATAPGAIEVQPIQENPNFPASTILKPGDSIARIDGEMVLDTMDVRAQILSRAPGDTLPVTIVRGGEPMDLDLPLGSFDELGGGARLEPQVIERALELRWARLGIVLAEPGTIGGAIDERLWSHAAFPEGVEPDPQTPSRRTAPALIVGGAGEVGVKPMNVLVPAKPWAAPETIIARSIQVQGKFISQRYFRLIAEKNLLGSHTDLLRDRLRAQGQARPEDRLDAAELEQIRMQIEINTVESGMIEAELVAITAKIAELEETAKKLPSNREKAATLPKDTSSAGPRNDP